MNNTIDSNNPNLGEGYTIYEYVVKRALYLKELSVFFYVLFHKPTGTRHVHISNQDNENTFSVGFKTVPYDSTGVAHILEHTVLCGSKKYPVRDPFFSMLKRSLNTFMNAFTASDWTMYPFSTQNEKDFYNLMDVYLDSTFFPKIDELSFKQEGHRLEIEKNKVNENEFSLVYKGVVYNEMKGAMSSPQQVMVRSLMNALYPETTYRYNSGGDPVMIPRLTHDQLKAFHRRHYHPSNAFFYTYGNLPLEKHLGVIHNKVLTHFESIDPKTDVPSQTRWEEEKRVTYAYALSETEDPEKKYQISVAWLLADIKNTFDVLSLVLLERILLGNAASPLRKALIDSKLGTALSDGTGYDHDNRDTMFACGLKDVKKASAEQVRSIIFKTLENLVERGIDKDIIESAIHQLEFHHKEVTNTPYPYGIQLLLHFSGSWFHGADPARAIQIDSDIEKIRENVSKGGFFENLIQQYFLDNTHRVLFTLVPDQSLEKKETKRISDELEGIKADLTMSEIEKIKADQEALSRLQEEQEDISILPTLALSDIPPEINRVEEKSFPDDDSLSIYDQPTSGVLYFSSIFKLVDVEKELLSFAPVFAYLFPKIGTRKRDYVKMARLMDAHTGGIGMAAHVRTGFKTRMCTPFFSLNGKCLNRNQGKLFEILEELIYEFAPSDLDRIKTLLLQYRAGLEAGVVQNGHRLAISLASRNFSKTRMLDEMWHGIHQLSTLKSMTDNLTGETLKTLSAQLIRMGKAIFTKDNMGIGLIGEENILSSAAMSAQSIQSGLIKEQLPRNNKTNGNSEAGAEDNLPYEGWSTSSAVSFVAGSFQASPMGHEDAPTLFVVSKLLRSMYLHKEIREKGGAYGGFALYNMEDGVFSLASYRDPHIVSTLKVFAGVEGFLKSSVYNDEDIKEAILQACSEIDKPDAPGTAGRKAFLRKITGISDEDRLAFKKGILAVTRDKVMSVVEKYFNADKNKRAVAVISGRGPLEEANKQLAHPLNIKEI